MAFDFPNSPALGTVFSPSGGPSWQWNGQGWVNVVPAGGVIGNIVTTLLTTPGAGTYTKPAGLRFIQVECVGGGGGGGGAGTTAASQYSAGGGGGGGGYVRYLYAASDLPASVAYTVGAAGAAGGAGGSSVFNNLTGGGGGAGVIGSAGTATNTTAGGTGGAATSTEPGAAITINGGNGGIGHIVWPAAPWMTRGHGGTSFLTQLTPMNPNGGTAAGAAGRLYGGGGSGCSNAPSSSLQAAGVGGAGCIILTEYY